jgi:hypothetical protein
MAKANDKIDEADNNAYYAQHLAERKARQRRAWRAVPREIRAVRDLDALYRRLSFISPRSDEIQRQLRHIEAEIDARALREHPEPPDLRGFVYLVCCGDRYKIGRTRDVAKRLRSLQTAASLPLVLVASAAVEDSAASEAELHRRYAHRRTHGEWFALTPDDLAAIVAEIGALL